MSAALARADQRHCWCFSAGTERFVGASGGHHQGPQEISGPTLLPTGSTKKEMRPIGTFNTVDEAVAALAEAQTKYAAGGEAAVWQKEKEQRAPRGSVRITCPHIPAHCWHTLREHSTC